LTIDDSLPMQQAAEKIAASVVAESEVTVSTTGYSWP
jgi:hypothetical protein